MIVGFLGIIWYKHNFELEELEVGEMMARKTKCRACLAYDDTPKTKQDSMYFHEGECLQKYLKHKEFLAKEKAEKDELFYKLVEIHGLEKTSDIPPLFFQKIEELRNDNWVLGKHHKRYKKGVPYKGISYTYDFCLDKIQTALIRKADSPLLEQMNYCLGIVRNNIVDAFNHAKKTLKQKEQRNKVLDDIEKNNAIKEKIKEVQTSPRNSEDDDKVDLTSLFD